MVIRDLPKVESGVRFSLPALIFNHISMETPAVTSGDRTRYIAAGVGIIILAAITAMAFSNKDDEQKSADSAPTNTTAEVTTSTTTPNTTTVDTGDKTTNVKAKPKTAKPFASYQKALESYQYKFQFVNCTAVPAKLTFKQGVKVMLDNRDAVARTIGIGNTKYTIQAYDFVIATAPAAGNYALTCAGRTVGEVKTQK